MARMRRLRGSTNIRGADGSPYGVIVQMMERYCSRVKLMDHDGKGSRKRRQYFSLIRLTVDERLQALQ